MKDFFNNKSIKFLTITLIAVIVISILGATGNPVISSAFGYLTKGMSKVSATVTKAGTEKTYEQLKKENEKLKKEIADLRVQLVDYYDLQDENARLWKYYDIKKEHSDYEILPASVIRRDANDDFYSFTVDVGIADGVQEQDPVITENGLIGFISSVNASNCKVTTILSPNTQVGAVDKKTKDSGIITGNSLYCDQNLTTLTKIDATSTVKKGDIVTTSGLGGIYPANIIIGQVQSVKYDEYDATKYAVIKPYENIQTVTDVVILTDFNNKGEITVEHSEDN